MGAVRALTALLVTPSSPRSLSVPSSESDSADSISILILSIRTMSGRLQVLFDAALQSYEKQTGMRLIDHPLARQLENCHSVDSIMDILQQQARALTDFRRDDGKAVNSLKRAVYVLHALSSSTTLGEGVGLVRRMASLGPKAIPLISQSLTVTLVS